MGEIYTIVPGQLSTSQGAVKLSQKKHCSLLSLLSTEFLGKKENQDLIPSPVPYTHRTTVPLYRGNDYLKNIIIYYLQYDIT